MQVAALGAAVVAIVWTAISGMAHGMWYLALAAVGVTFIVGVLLRFHVLPQLISLLKR
jgi:hypothetical protein